jgi:hypothetical protein
VSLYWVGVYSAYATAATSVVGLLFQVFLHVYFPTVSGEPDKGAIAGRLREVYRVTVGPILVLSAGSIVGVLWLLGPEFPLRWGLVLLFSLNNCVYVFYQLYVWLLTSAGIHGVRIATRILMVGAVLNVGAVLGGVVWFGVAGAIAGNLLVNTMFGVVYYQQALSLGAEKQGHGAIA